MKIFRLALILLVAALVLALAGCDGPPARSGPYAQFNGPTVSVQEVRAAMERGENMILIGVVQPIAAKIPFLAQARHIPGSYMVWRPDYSSSGSDAAIDPRITGMRRSVPEMEELLSRANATPDSTVVVWSTDAMHDAARVVWQLQMLGMRNVSYMDGGSNAWIAAGYPTRRGVRLNSLPVRSNFRAPNYNPSSFNATIEQVVHALNNPDEWVVIDTRAPAEFNGQRVGASSGAFGTGRIAGTVHINWTAAVNPDTQLLKSKAELEAIYLDVIRGRNVIAFCQSGVRSAHTMHVLAYALGLPNVLNYEGSWIEWSFAASSVSDGRWPHILSLTEEWTDNNGPI